MSLPETPETPETPEIPEAPETPETPRPPAFPLAADVERLVAAQHPNGAFPAGAEFSQYQHCWLRDGSFIAHALDAVGRHESAARFHEWVASTLEPLEPRVEELLAKRARGEPITEFEFLPARFTVDGEWSDDGWPNFQLDGYGQWLWSLAAHLRLTGRAEIPRNLMHGVRVVVRYLGEFWDQPCYDSWEEHRSQLHTSTLASVYAGLRDIAAYLPEAENGVDMAPGGGRMAAQTAAAVLQFIRSECVQDGALVKYVRNRAVDASLLWLALPFEVFAVDDPVMLATADRIEEELLGGGVRRYVADTYYGGGEWILLTAWLAWYWHRVGRQDDAARLMAWIELQRDASGALPEQVPGENCHPRFLEQWTDEWGPSAKPLLWSHAMVVVVRAAMHGGGAPPTDAGGRRGPG